MQDRPYICPRGGRVGIMIFAIRRWLNDITPLPAEPMQREYVLSVSDVISVVYVLYTFLCLLRGKLGQQVQRSARCMTALY